MGSKQRSLSGQTQLSFPATVIWYERVGMAFILASQCRPSVLHSVPKSLDDARKSFAPSFLVTRHFFIISKLPPVSSIPAPQVFWTGAASAASSPPPSLKVNPDSSVFLGSGSQTALVGVEWVRTGMGSRMSQRPVWQVEQRCDSGLSAGWCLVGLLGFCRWMDAEGL